MKKVLIVDDEFLAREVVKGYLIGEDNFEIVGECANGFDAIKAIDELNPDLIFLDVQMPKISGFEMLEILENPPQVIFTTAFNEFAVKAFEVNAIDYLLKPISKERFKSALEKVNSKSSDQSQPVNPDITLQEELTRIVIKNNNEIIILPLDRITHLEAYDDYVKIHTKDKSFLKKKTMNFYEENLDGKQFVRVHRSFIINVNYLTKIESFEKNKFIAKLGEELQIPISRTSYPNLKEMLDV